MVLAIEPRVVEAGRHLIGTENVVVVTPSGGDTLNQFPAGPLELP
jgi:Xaa-Pro aminopeptidase